MSNMQKRMRTSTSAKIWVLLTPAERKAVLVLLPLMGISMILETVGIGLVVPAIALLVENDIASMYPKTRPVLHMLGNPTQTQLVSGGMGALVGIYLLKNTFLAYLTWRQNRFANEVRVQLSQRLFTTYLRQPYTFHLQRNSAQLVRNVNESASFQAAVFQSMMLVTEGLVLAGITTLLLMVEPVGALIVMLALGSASWAYQRVTRRHILRWGELRMHHDGLATQHTLQGLGGAKDIKLLGREGSFLSQFLLHNTQSARAKTSQMTLQTLPRLWLELLAVTGLAMLVLVMLAQGREAASIVPTLGLFAVAAFRLVPSANRILMSVHALRYSLPPINIIYEELQLAAPEPPLHTNRTSGFQTRIDLSNISYTYPDAMTEALQGLCLTIRKGETIGFIGPSGAGKSTVVDVILGLLTPSAGGVVVDGQDIQLNLRAWQDQIGYVPQSIYLTDDTLRRNVAFGLPDAQIDDVAVKHAIRASQLEQFVGSLPYGLETVVGERGIRLSGGQRQRIGIARSLYHDPAVLVLDEATSALDTVAEGGVMQAIIGLRRSKTILIVAHRMSTVAHSDRVYRLEKGRIVEEGDPGTMLSQGSQQFITQAQVT